MQKHTVTRGKLELITLKMPQYNDNRTRTIRIWLPPGYETSTAATRYDVLFMHDGQNLFDAFTSFVGEWEIDEAIGNMIDEGYEGAVVIGIDSSKDRLNELSPSWERNERGAIIDAPSGELYARFIVETVLPYIYANYKVKQTRKGTVIGGSSMGGVMSLYMALTYPHIFGRALLFSTALSLYNEKAIDNFITSKLKTLSNTPHLYIYSGNAGGDYEIGKYVDILRGKLVHYGYNAKNIMTLLDENADHNEYAWAKHFPNAYKSLLSM